MNNNYYENQISLINDNNVNINSEGDGKVFLKLILLILSIILILSFSFDFIAGFFIDNMSLKTQLKIESLFNTIGFGYENYKESKYKNEIIKLNNIKKRIISLDKNIQDKSSLPIFIIKNENVNAMVSPNGTIYFTTGLLDKKLSEPELAFVLAHEIGHYSHKDHLKAISKKIFLISICTLGGLNQQMSTITKEITEADYLSHSRRQEEKADLYAGEMLIKLYGSNEGGKKFIMKLNENEKTPEFFQYFSTHPSWKKRLKILEKQWLRHAIAKKFLK